MAKNVKIRIALSGAKKAGQGLKLVAGGLANIGAKASLVGFGFGALSTKLAGDFQKSLFEVKTLMGETGQSIESMSSELRNASASSGLALSSLSKAKYDIVSAGFAGAAESAKVLNASTMLAVGGVTSAAAAADLLTTSLNAYGKSSEESTDVSDVLFTTVRLGKTTMSELAGALGQVLPFAKSANLDLRGVGSAMATLTASGINTFEATTALKSAIVALTAPTEGAKKAMEEAGIEVVRFKDGSLDLSNTVEQFVGVPQDVMTKFIPNIRAVAAIQTMANNFETLESNVNEFSTNTAGASQKAFETMTGAFNTQFSMLKNNVQNIMITIGNAIIEKIQPKIEQLNTVLSELGEIGFENIASALVANLDAIMETLNTVVVLAMERVAEHVQIAGLTIKRELADIIPFMGGTVEELDEEIAKLTENLGEKNSEALSRMKEEIEATFTFIKEQSETSQVGAEEVQKQGQKAIANDLKIRKANTNEIIGLEEKKLFVAKKVNKGLGKVTEETKRLNAEQAVAYGVSASSAEKAAQQTVRSAIRVAVAEQIKKAVVSIPFPFNIVAAAGAGLVVSNAIERNLSVASKLKFAEGGIVPGVGNQDTVPAMLTPGEVILNQAQQQNLVNGMGITINIQGNVLGTREFVRDTLVPEINKAVRYS